MGVAMKWIPATEVAALLSVTTQAIRKACPKLQLAGMAKLERPEAGGKACWWVRRDYSPRLAEIKPADAVAANVTQLTAAQREELNEFEAIYRRWRQACVAALRAPYPKPQQQVTREFLAKLRAEACRHEPSERTLERWHYNFTKGKMGIQAFLDGRWQRAAKVKDARMLKEAARFYLDSSDPSVAECFRAAEQQAKAEGWRVWKISTVKNHIRRLPKARKVYAREGPEAFKNKCGPYIKRSYGGLASNEIWQSDHHRMDVICRAGEKVDRVTGEATPIHNRPWLTSWFDVRSRKVLAFKIRAADPDSGVVLAVFGQACKEFGVPVRVYLDNGKDYDARDFTGETKAERRRRMEEAPDADAPATGIYQRLGVQHMHAGKYNARAKLLERWHRTLKEQFSKKWDTYTGGHTKEKPERLADMVKEGHAPTVEELAAAFAEYVAVYNGTIHQGDAMKCTPDQAWAENLHEKRMAKAETLELALCRLVGPVKIGRNGVQYHGLQFGQYDTCAMQGERVYLRVDDSDLSKVSVWDLDERFMCFARANRVLPPNANRETLREAIKQQRQAVKLMKKAREAGPRIHDDIPATMFRIEQERAAAQAKAQQQADMPAPTIVPIHSPLDGEVERYKLAKAAAEGTTAALPNFNPFSRENVERELEAFGANDEWKDEPPQRTLQEQEKGFRSMILCRVMDFSYEGPPCGPVLAEIDQIEDAAERVRRLEQFLYVESATVERMPSLTDICGGAA